MQSERAWDQLLHICQDIQSSLSLKEQDTTFVDISKIENLVTELNQLNINFSFSSSWKNLSVATQEKLRFLITQCNQLVKLHMAVITNELKRIHFTWDQLKTELSDNTLTYDKPKSHSI